MKLFLAQFNQPRMTLLSIAQPQLSPAFHMNSSSALLFFSFDLNKKKYQSQK
jgi:hypothetical protein